MAAVSIRGLRRSSRRRKRPPSFYLESVMALWKEKGKRYLGRSSLKKTRSTSKESLQHSRLSSVERLLETGLLNGLPVACFSEELGAHVPGVIMGSGFLCGCYQCNFKGEVLIGKLFEEHAGIDTNFHTDHIYLSTGTSVYDIFEAVKNVPYDDFLVKILKLRMDLKGVKFYEEPPWVPIMSFTGKMTRRKSSDGAIHRPIATVKNDPKESSRESPTKGVTFNELDKVKFSAVSDSLQNTLGPSTQFKYYTRYNPERRLVDVRGLLSTGLLEGLKVIYKRNEARLEALIRGSAYGCGCSSCNYAKIVTAKELEAHAGEFSKCPNENIYLDSGITLTKLVNKLKGIPLCLVGNCLQEMIKCPPNYSCFEIWKDYFKMGSGFQDLRPNFDGQLEVNRQCCTVQRKHRKVRSIGSTSDPDRILNFVGDEEQLGPAVRKIAKPLLNNTQGFVVSTRHKLKRVMQSQKGILVHCTICKERCTALVDQADPKFILFCNQCDRAYHVGCLKDQESFNIKDALNGSWFCCNDCTWVHNCLRNLCALGAKQVPAPFLNLLKKPHAAVSTRFNLKWQVLGGGNTEDQILLSEALKFIQKAFRPILHENEDIIRQMIYGNQVAGTGQDFRGVLCIVIKLDEEIVSIAVLRVFGKCIAELPLVTTSKKWREKGYFRMLLSLIEELLCLLQVRFLVAPVHEKMEAIWIHKLGFARALDQKVQLLKEQHGLILFEDTSLLQKKIRATAD